MINKGKKDRAIVQAIHTKFNERVLLIIRNFQKDQHNNLNYFADDLIAKHGLDRQQLNLLMLESATPEALVPIASRKCKTFSLESIIFIQSFHYTTKKNYLVVSFD